MKRVISAKGKNGANSKLKKGGRKNIEDLFRKSRSGDIFLKFSEDDLLQIKISELRDLAKVLEVILANEFKSKRDLVERICSTAEYINSFETYD